MPGRLYLRVRWGRQGALPQYALYPSRRMYRLRRLRARMPVAGDLRGTGRPRNFQGRYRAESQDPRYGRPIQGQDLCRDRASDARANRGQQSQVGLDRGLRHAPRQTLRASQITRTTYKLAWRSRPRQSFFRAAHISAGADSQFRSALNAVGGRRPVAALLHYPLLTVFEPALLSHLVAFGLALAIAPTPLLAAFAPAVDGRDLD